MKKKRTVVVKTTVDYVVEVQADSIWQATDLAMQVVEGGNVNNLPINSIKPISASVVNFTPNRTAKTKSGNFMSAYSYDAREVEE